jgi:hypothetical protein
VHSFFLFLDVSHSPKSNCLSFASFISKEAPFHLLFLPQCYQTATHIQTVINDNNCNLSAFYANAVLMFHMLASKWHAACSYMKPILKSALKHERGSFYGIAITWEHIKEEFTCN